MNKKLDSILAIMVLVIVLLLVVAAFFAPCWFYSFTHEVPARCLSNFKG